MRPYTLTQTDQNTVKSSCRRAGHTFFKILHRQFVLGIVARTGRQLGKAHGLQLTSHVLSSSDIR